MREIDHLTACFREEGGNHLQAAIRDGFMLTRRGGPVFAKVNHYCTAEKYRKCIVFFSKIALGIQSS
eukprot:c28261_g3_i1 orf=271-471(-)